MSIMDHSSVLRRLGWRMIVVTTLLLSLSASAVHAESAVSPAAGEGNHYIIFASGYQCFGLITDINPFGGAEPTDPHNPRGEWKTLRDALLLSSGEQTGGDSAVSRSSFAKVIQDFNFSTTDASEPPNWNGSANPNDGNHLDDRFLYYSYTGEWSNWPQMYNPEYTIGDTGFRADPNNPTTAICEKRDGEIFAPRGETELFDARAGYLQKMIDAIVNGENGPGGNREADPNASFTIIGHSQGAAIVTYWAGSEISGGSRHRIRNIIILHGFTKGKAVVDLPVLTLTDRYEQDVVETMIDSVNHVPIYSIRHRNDRAAPNANKLRGTWYFTEIWGHDTPGWHWLAKDSPAAARAIAVAIASNSIGRPSQNTPLQAGRYDQPFDWIGAGGLFDSLANAAVIPISPPGWIPGLPIISAGPLTAEDYFNLDVDKAEVQELQVIPHRPEVNDIDIKIDFLPFFRIKYYLKDSADLEHRWDVKASPPTQPSGGVKSLTSQGSNIAFTQAQFTANDYVEYAGPVEASGVDLIAVIDASGSMRGDKIVQAQEAAILLLNQASANDRIGVVWFNGDEGTIFPLAQAIAQNKSAAEQAIRSLANASGSISIGDTGSTSVGGGLNEALAELSRNGKAGSLPVFVLLTDGAENENPYWKCSLANPDGDTCNQEVFQNVFQADVSVHTVGLALSTELPRRVLQDIASSTNAIFRDTASAENLLQIYGEIANTVLGRQLYQLTQSTVSPGGSIEFTTSVDSGTKQIQFQLTWANTATNLDLELIDPDGNLINAANVSNFSNVEYGRGTTYVIFDVNQPKAGQWTYRILNSTQTRMTRLGKDVVRTVTNVDFTVNVNGISDLTVDNTSTSGSLFLTYEPVELSVNLSDPAPIQNATVTAEIAKPDGSILQIPLKMQGLDGNRPIAGEYVAKFVPRQKGIYSIRITATGKANDGSPFERSLSFSLFVEENAQPPADLQTTIVKIPDTKPATPEYCIAYRNDGPVAAQETYLHLLQNIGTIDSSFGIPMDKGGGISEWQLGSVASDTEFTDRIRLSTSGPITNGIAYLSINDGMSLEESNDPNFDPYSTSTYDPEISNNSGVSSNEDLDISLRQGWNLLGLPKEFPMRTPVGVLCPLSAELDVVLGFDEQGLTYDPNLPEFSTLKEFDPLHGYWFRTNTDGKLRIPGYLLAANEPIVLNKGWNLVAYLPKQSLVITEALTTIAGKYDTVLGFDGGAASYNTSIPPQLNTLQQFTSGSAFWIHMLEAAVLQFPTNSSAVARIADSTNRYQSVAGIAATNEWINIYSTNSTYNGQPLTPGSIVTAVGEDGRLLGQMSVREEGWYGLLAVYGDDAYTAELDGARVGERIRFLINGQPATITNGMSPVWTANGDLMQVDLAASGPQLDRRLYLPNIGR